LTLLPLFHERPTQSNLRDGLKKKTKGIFYGEQPIEVATTIIALDLFNDVTKTEKV
jgi:hypothetical protein